MQVVRRCKGLRARRKFSKQCHIQVSGYSYQASPLQQAKFQQIATRTPASLQATPAPVSPAPEPVHGLSSAWRCPLLGPCLSAALSPHWHCSVPGAAAAGAPPPSCEQPARHGPEWGGTHNNGRTWAVMWQCRATVTSVPRLTTQQALCLEAHAHIMQKVPGCIILYGPMRSFVPCPHTFASCLPASFSCLRTAGRSTATLPGPDPRPALAEAAAAAAAAATRLAAAAAALQASSCSLATCT